MPMTATQVQQLYVAYFNRPADYLGQEYWKTQDATAAAKAFAASAQYAATYAGMDTGARVNAIYQNLFGHAADLPGLTYWSNQVQSGRLTIADVVVAVSNGAQGTDKAAYDAKVSAATAFTTALDTTAEVTGYSGTAANDAAKAWLAGINSAAQATTATASAALNATVASVTAGAGSTTTNSIALTTTLDIKDGTGGNDKFIGAYANVADSDTVNNGDTLDGKGGRDTLSVTVASAVGPAPVLTLSNIETVEFRPTASLAFDGANWSGVDTIKVINSGSNNATTVLTTVNNLRSNVTFELNDVAVATDNADALSVTYRAGALGVAETLRINGTNVGGSRRKDKRLSERSGGRASKAARLCPIREGVSAK